MTAFSPRCLALLAAVSLLAGCEALGIDSPDKLAAQKEADGKAVGSACRHALRAIEDCYTLNPKASRAAVFGGWREMDEYMRENKLEGIAPVLAKLPKTDAADAEPDDTPSAKAAEHHGAGGKAAAGKSKTAVRAS